MKTRIGWKEIPEVSQLEEESGWNYICCTHEGVRRRAMIVQLQRHNLRVDSRHECARER